MTTASLLQHVHSFKVWTLLVNLLGNEHWGAVDSIKPYEKQLPLK